MHVHVKAETGDAKFWIDPDIELAMHRGLQPHQLTEIHRLVEEHEDEIRNAWRRHLGD